MRAWEEIKMSLSKLATLGKRHRHGEYDACVEALQKELEPAAKRRKSPFLRLSNILSNMEQIRRQQTGCAGDKRLAELRKILDMFKWTRSVDQIKFHEDFIRLCLRQIYGADFEPNRDRLFREFGLSEMKTGSAVTCPRRWGKSVAVGMFIIAMLMVCLGITIAVFSPTQRQSTAMRESVLKLAHELPPKYSRRIISGGGKELLTVLAPDAVDDDGYPLEPVAQLIEARRVNRLFTYPCNNEGAVFLETCSSTP